MTADRAADDPIEPPWLVDLPRDDRGFLVPAESTWQGGQPIIASNDADRGLVLALNRCCAVCGYPLSGTGYRPFSQRDAARARGAERGSTTDYGAAIHLSCVLYSAQMCPHLREERARLQRGNTVNPGARRGTLAAVMGFATTGLLMATPPAIARGGHTALFVYQDLTFELTYGNGREVREQYVQAIEDDASEIDLSTKRMYWTGSNRDARQLDRAIDATYEKLGAREPDAVYPVDPHGYYEMFLV